MNHHLTIHYSVFRSHHHFFFTKLVSILVAKSLLHAPRCPSPLRLSLNVTHPHKGLHTESQGAHEYKVYSQANLHKFKRSQTAMESRVRRAWVWRIWGICTHVSHTDTCKSTHTLSFPPYSLQWEPCIAAFTCLSWKKSLKKKKSLRCSDGSDSPRLPFLLLSTISPLQHSSFLPLPLRRSRTSYPDTRTFKWKPFYFPVPSPPPSRSSHFTPLFLFSAFLPCCLP